MKKNEVRVKDGWIRIYDIWLYMYKDIYLNEIYHHLLCAHRIFQHFFSFHVAVA